MARTNEHKQNAFSAQIHESEPPGDILVFLTGMDEVDECVGSLKEFSREKAANRHGLKVIMQDRFVADASKGIIYQIGIKISSTPKRLSLHSISIRL